MKVTPLDLPEVLLIEPDVFGDERGYFYETWNQKRYEAAGIPGPFVQDNLSYSQHGVLRGLHFQHPHPQGKLVSVLKGEVYDVAVDIRQGSPRFGQWVGVYLGAENQRQLWVPEGFAHGFCVTGADALFTYKCTDFYSPESEGSIRWDDPRIGIDWPIREAMVSDKDQAAAGLSEMAEERLPRFRESAP
jgi:dTDP-4-dehydrorhamnose 3,5-epimerase